MKEEMVVIKACVYANTKGNYVPVAFMAVPREVEFFDLKTNKPVSYREAQWFVHEHIVPHTSGVRIVPLGRYRPIRGIIEKMALTEFERLMENLGFHYLCTIPSYGMKDPYEVYNAFNLMLKGAKVLVAPASKTEQGNRIEPNMEHFREHNPSAVDVFNRQIKELTCEHNKGAAVQLYRYAHGVSVHDALEAVNRIILEE